MKRIAELDGLRGLASLVVAIYHLECGFFWAEYGWAGVDLFFLLSGYLITSIILRNGDKPGFLTQFYMRRGLRIWPIYYLTLIAAALFYSLCMNGIRLDGMPYYLLYLQYVPTYWNGVNPPLDMPISHTWTLAAEEQFYLIWPPLLVLLGSKRLLPMIAFTSALAIGMRAFGYPKTLLLTRCDSLALGALLAWLFLDVEWAQTHKKKLRLLFLAISCGLILISVVYWRVTSIVPFRPDPQNPAWEIFFIDLMMTCLLGLVLTAVGSPILAPLRVKWVVALGTISYGFYLYHPIIFPLALGLADRFHIGRPWWFEVGRILISIAAASASWVLIEKPILELKDRFPYGGVTKQS